MLRLFVLMIFIGCTTPLGHPPKLPELPRGSGKGEPFALAPLSIPNEGQAWIKIFRSRNRRFGTPELNEVLKLAIYRYRILSPRAKPLEIGDLSNERGGRALPHRSHQSGEDVDIRYQHKSSETGDPESDHWQEFFVKNHRLQPNYDLVENLKLISAFADDPRVKLVYVDAAIRSALISRVKTIQKSLFLKKLVPYPTHQTHFHVRVFSKSE